MHLFMATVPTVAKMQNQSRCPLTDKGKEEVIQSQRRIKHLFGANCKEMEDMMLDVVNQAQKDKFKTFFLMNESLKKTK